ncbi:aldehyde dehydrogenase family protein [Gracilibacillus caseinilyticus]|uniref:aldehyde dehydrogenase (NAD(+)) n=1 Tax=Gracilibacillus caseinilyticus TaxID=2932256 RepID=A0ABY4F3J4_9BACI|nr:aldehyde dehydrogenase family protein [Gracilibacillus caseinilyticus]UOQ50459.1 aldehyde dehydrogenase family protein [Gracilibacillus caseinilyticus]
MYNYTKQFINGEWIESTGNETIAVINPASEEKIGTIGSGTQEDLDKAVQAAKEAFPSFSQTSREERVQLLENIAKEYEKRKDEFINIITEELGSSVTFSEEVQYTMGLNHFKETAKILRDFPFSEEREDSYIQKDAIGVAGLITPWNFPTNQISTKLASALASGSTVVFKPASKTPFASILLTEVMDAAGVPKGVVNLVNGKGSTIGNGISSHPDIDFVSFTGSGKVGKKTMENAAQDIKKVSLELGGKSPIVVLDDADVDKAAHAALSNIASNTGQVCSAGTRIFIPKTMHDPFVDAVRRLVDEYPVGDPKDKNTFMGPQVSEDQWETVQEYIQIGIDDGAELIVGGKGKPEGLETGYYSRITMFTNVDHDSAIAQEEIFGPVMTVFTYDTLEEAIELANTTIYGLAGYIVGEDPATLTKVAKSIRAGRITINGAAADFSAPFGGFKQSGIGREWGDYGMEEFLEAKTILGMPK